MIRPVVTTELPECLSILQAAYEASAIEFGMTEENCPWRGRTRLPLEVFRQELENGCQMFVCVYQEMPVGFLSVKIENDRMYINDLAVLPEYQSRGFGRRMMQFAFRLATKNRCSAVELGMVHDNLLLRRWYESFGFVTIRLTHFPAVTYAVGTMEKCLIPATHI